MGRIWKVVGGEQTGGIVVRETAELTSAKLDRLETGAHVMQLELLNERLHFQLLDGHGPDTGWVSMKLKDLWHPLASLSTVAVSYIHLTELQLHTTD